MRQAILFSGFFAVAFAKVAFAQTESISAEEFVKLVDAHFALVRDLTFSFESRMDSVDKRVVISPERRQGTYQFVRGAAERTDVEVERQVQKDGEKRLESRRLSTSVVNGARKSTDSAGSGQASIGSNGGALDDSGMPRRIFYHSLLARYEKQIAQTFRFEGWERIGAQVCLKGSFALVAGGDPESGRMVFWFDLDHGANPLRMDVLREGKLLGQASDIKLAQFGPESARVWLPVSGKVTSYVYPDANRRSAISRSPCVVEEIIIDPASVRVNEGMPADAFEIEFKKGMVFVNELTGAAYRIGAPERAAVAVENVGPILDQSIQEADEQRATIEAPSLSRTTWTSGRIALVVAAVLGVACIVAAIVLRKRSA